ncbi:MAG: hypothetical protein AAF961_15205, partial [Planctomycetota bacterium]
VGTNSENRFWSFFEVDRQLEAALDTQAGAAVGRVSHPPFFDGGGDVTDESTFADRYPAIDYAALNGKQQEAYNFAHIAARLSRHGFACYKLDDDWNGADFLAHHMPTGDTLKVQLKGRVTIVRAFVGRDLWMAFPAGGAWFVVPHNELVDAWVKVNPKLLEAESWKGSTGKRHAPRPPSKLMPFLDRWKV